MSRLRLEKKEACGVFGICDGKCPVAPKILSGLMALQHRGQESFGVAVVREDEGLGLFKTMGLVGEGLTEGRLEMLWGRGGIGHVRYSTVGDSSLENAQPFLQTFPPSSSANLSSSITINQPRSKQEIALAHNGNMVNYLESRETLRRGGVELKSRCDAEIFTHLLGGSLQKTPDPFEALSAIAPLIEGAYSAVSVLGGGDILAFRDPLGFKPLCHGVAGEAKIVASESVAIDAVDGELLGDVAPGEALLMRGGRVERGRFAPSPRRAHCMFEYVYFSRPDSVIDGRSVYEVRLRLGVNLAKTYDNSVDVVIAVPDTSRPAAEGLSRTTGIPVEEGLIKNRYIHRTFIMPEQQSRENAVRTKLNPLKSVLQGRKVIVIDDSIVRGTTIRRIVEMVRKAGAREVHVRVTCPPIISPCFYGIDIATHGELVAAHMEVEKIAKTLGVNSLGYQTVEGLVEAIGLPREELCLACLTGVYPTPKAQAISDGMRVMIPANGRVRYIETANPQIPTPTSP